MSNGWSKSKEDKRKEAQARQLISKQRNQLIQNIQSLEENVARLEVRKAELEELLANPDTYKSEQDAASFNKEYHQIKENIDSNTEKWANTQEELEQLLSKIESVD